MFSFVLSQGTDFEGAIWNERADFCFCFCHFKERAVDESYMFFLFVFLQKKIDGLYLTHIKGPILNIQRCTMLSNSCLEAMLSDVY